MNIEFQTSTILFHTKIRYDGLWNVSKLNKTLQPFISQNVLISKRSNEKKKCFSNAVTSSRRESTRRVNKASVDKDVRLRATSERRVSPLPPYPLPRPSSPYHPRPTPIMMLTHRLRPAPLCWVFFWTNVLYFSRVVCCVNLDDRWMGCCRKMTLFRRYVLRNILTLKTVMITIYLLYDRKRNLSTWNYNSINSQVHYQ